MRRLMAALSAVVVALAVIAIPASAASNRSLNEQVSGAFSGSFGSVLNTPPCSVVNFRLDVTYTTAQGGTGSVHIAGCSNGGNLGGLFLQGSFTLLSPNGARLTGTCTGALPFAQSTVSFTLSPNGGTREFSHAAGTVLIDGTISGGGIAAPVTGSLGGALVRGAG